MHIGQNLAFMAGGLQSLTSIIQSVQSFSVTVTTTSNTASLSAVSSMNEATCFWAGQTTTDSNVAGASRDFSAGKFALTSTSQITATKNTTGTYTITMNGFVVNWASDAILSVQRGTVTATAATTGTASFTAVDLNNSYCTMLGVNTTYTSSVMSNFWSRVNLSSSSQITLTRNAGGSNVTASYEVTQHPVGVLNSAPQQSTISLTGATTNNNASLSPSIDQRYSIPIWNGFTSSMANNDCSKRCEMYLSASSGNTCTTVVAFKNSTSASSNDAVVGVTTVEYTSRFIQTRQPVSASYGISIANPATNGSHTDGALTNTAKAIVLHHGMSSVGAITRNDMNDTRLSITNTTDIRADCNTTPTVTTGDSDTRFIKLEFK